MKQTLCIIGSGWRGELILRVASLLPESFTVGGITTRDIQKAQRLQQRYGAPVFEDYHEMIRQARPDFVVVAPSSSVLPGIAAELSCQGIPVLAETFCLPTLGEQHAFYQAAGGKQNRMQFLEQYHLQPMQQARLAFAQSGRLGRVFEAQVSLAQCYHGISVMRRMLGITFEDARITASTFLGRITAGPGRSGDPEEDKLVDDLQTLGWFDFGDRLGVFDNSKQQIRSWIRSHRTILLGERGEISNDRIRYLLDYRTPTETSFVRLRVDQEESLEGLGFKAIAADGQWYFANPFQGLPMIDDEIAVGCALQRMAHYVAQGIPFYPMEEALQDQYLSILMEQSAAEGRPVHSEHQPWAE